MTIREAKQATLQPDGDVVAATISELRSTLRALLEAGVRQLTVDLTNTHMIDSTGLGLLISAHNSLQKIGGELAVIQASSGILALMTGMRMHQHFHVSGQE